MAQHVLDDKIAIDQLLDERLHETGTASLSVEITGMQRCRITSAPPRQIASGICRSRRKLDRLGVDIALQLGAPFHFMQCQKKS